MPTNVSAKKFKLPPQPELLSLLQGEIQCDHIDIAKITKIISGDVAASAQVLKTINSAFFGIKVDVTSVQHAISLMGVDAIVDLIMGLELEKSLNDELVALPRFWDSAKNTASLCAFLANKLELYDASQAYTLGLFHDVGIPLMASKFPDYLETLKAVNEDGSGLTTDLEDKRYNTNHADMGYFLSREWGLPNNVRQVIRQHHDCMPILKKSSANTDDVTKLMAILKLAEWGSEVHRSGEAAHEWRKISSTLLETLYLSEDDSLDLLEDMKDVLISLQ